MAAVCAVGVGMLTGLASAAEIGANDDTAKFAADGGAVFYRQMAALGLRRKGLKADEVASATLAVATAMLRTIGEPLQRKQQPQTSYEAKFSGPYTVASALIGGGGLGLGIEDFTDALARDPIRRALMSSISVIGDPRCDAIFPDQAPAILSVTAKDGRRLVEQVLVNRGGPQHPLSPEELSVKFSENCRGVLTSEATEALRSSIDGMAAAVDLTEIVRLLATVADQDVAS